MSTLAIDYPLTSFPELPVKNGQSFHGYVHDGVVTLVVSSPPALDPASPSDSIGYIEKWRGLFSAPPEDQLAADPRLAYLVEKHLK